VPRQNRQKPAFRSYFVLRNFRSERSSTRRRTSLLAIQTVVHLGNVDKRDRRGSFLHGSFYRYALYYVLVRVSKPAASVTTIITGWVINTCLILKFFDLLLTEGYNIL